MNKKSYSQILDHVARDHMTANPDLAPRILARIQKGKSRTMQPRMKIIAAVCLILFVLVIGLVSVPSVRAAIQRWIGYAPGIGLVSEGQVRVLAEPVSVTRDGITLTVEEVWAASDRTLIQVSIEGWPWRKLVDDSPANGCLDPAFLRLPDRELTHTQPQSSIGWATGYELRSLYPAIPATENEVTFVLPCLSLASPGEAPEGWELPLRLVPAPPDTVFPIIEISTPVAATPTLPVQTNDTLSTEGVSLALDRAVQMDDGYLLYVTIHYENTGLSWIDLPIPTTLHLLDSSGREVSHELDWEATNEVQTTLVPGQTAFAIKTASIQSAGPLTLILDSIVASVNTDARFTFDPGPEPQPGQVWELNEEIDLGYGQSVRVSKVTYNLTDGTQAWLSFEMESETGVMYTTLLDKAHPLTGLAGGGGGGSFSTGPFTSDLYYNEPLPKGPLTVDLVSIAVHVPGHWEASWTPPEAQTQSMPTSQPSACLTRESWQQALQAQPPLPEGLAGTLALAQVPPPGYYYQVSIAKLDGSSSKLIGLGSAPSLSRDGTRVVHMGPAIDGPADGLYITDIASGNTSLLPGTTTGDMNPLWSQNGQTVAFTRGPSSGLIGAPGPYNIFLTNVDGSGFRQLTEGMEANYAQAWMPGGNELLYTVASRDGASLRLMDIQSGEVSPLFDINYNGTVVVSPDGKRLAFEEMLPLEKYGLFVSDLDGSNRKLLADGEPYTVTVPAWSPDGSWVIATVHDPDGNKPPMLALIQVDTCNVIPLPELNGYVTSWLP